MVNIRVLIYMNPLAVDKIAKKFLYFKDSGFLYTKQLIAGLPETWKFTVLVPPGFNRGFFSHNHNVDCVDYDYSTSIHQNRYHFNRNILQSVLPYGVDIDVVINNQPEVSANISAFFQNQRRESPIIINYFHWIDCVQSSAYSKSLSGYIYRQIDGVENASVSCFHTPTAKSFYDESAGKILKNPPGYKTEYFSPMPTIFGDDDLQVPEKKIILFNHRLNNSTGWKEVVRTCEELRKTRTDFILWLTDDQNLKEASEFAKHDWIITKGVPFSQYGTLIKKAHFSICNTTGYATWNMAVLDSVANGSLPLIVERQVYRDMFSGTGVYFNGNLMETISAHLDKSKSENDLAAMNMVLPKENHWIEDYVVEHITTRVTGKEIVKFNDVKQYILENIGCTKKDFINEFWSFHANSNFQLIRWCLLLAGFYDDTTSVETKWYLEPTEHLRFNPHSQNQIGLF